MMEWIVIEHCTANDSAHDTAGKYCQETLTDALNVPGGCVLRTIVHGPDFGTSMSVSVATVHLPGMRVEKGDPFGELVALVPKLLRRGHLS